MRDLPLSIVARRSASADDDALFGSEIVLVVDDDPDVRRVTRMALEHFGYTVFDAADGSAAVSVTDRLNAPVDLLITDLMMPELSGRELVEQLAMEDRLPKVLLMSGYTDDEVIRRRLPTQRYPFIQKPFTPQELARSVRAILDEARSGR